MHTHLSSEIARHQQAELHRQADKARLARAALPSPRRRRRITLGAFRRPTLMTVDTRGLGAA